MLLHELLLCELLSRSRCYRSHRFYWPPLLVTRSEQRVTPAPRVSQARENRMPHSCVNHCRQCTNPWLLSFSRLQTLTTTARVHCVRRLVTPTPWEEARFNLISRVRASTRSAHLPYCQP